MLTQEYGTASNIKSRVNRLSVLAAITSTQQRLKLYNRVPPNGLVLFVGTILTDEGKDWYSAGWAWFSQVRMTQKALLSSSRLYDLQELCVRTLSSDTIKRNGIC